MYSYADRLRAVELYLKLGKRIKATILQLGCAGSAFSGNQQTNNFNDEGGKLLGYTFPRVPLPQRMII